MKNRRNIVEQKYPPENPNDIWLKDGKFYRSTSEGWVVIDSETEYTSKESMIADNPKGGTIGIDKETGEASIYNDVSKQWSPLSGGGGMKETTWQELKDKRDNGELTPGSLYRITDYNCTTTQANTRSAGHQFDIVLLALSEDKLAEEGWAMMNESNVYDVTFADGVTKKCWIYETPDFDTIVDINTLLGTEDIILSEDASINEETKTIIITNEEYGSSSLSREGLTYNYFQNSNLSAWKVWYCLDNDTERFAWADDRDSYGIICPGNIDGEPKGIYIRDVENDVGSSTRLYAWYNKEEDAYCYTFSPNPKIGDSTTDIDGDGGSGAGKITGFVGIGRGVIYRLIDEWNNDVAYDFKNIMYKEPVTDGYYAYDGEEVFVYTFSYYDIDNDVFYDASMINGKDDIAGESQFCQDNKISPMITNDGHELNFTEIFNVFSITEETIETSYRNNLGGMRNRFKGSTIGIDIVGKNGNLLVEDGYCVTFINCEAGDFEQYGSYNAYSMYIMGKKVLTES